MAAKPQPNVASVRGGITTCVPTQINLPTCPGTENGHHASSGFPVRRTPLLVPSILLPFSLMWTAVYQFLFSQLRIPCAHCPLLTCQIVPADRWEERGTLFSLSQNVGSYCACEHGAAKRFLFFQRVDGNRNSTELWPPTRTKLPGRLSCCFL